MPEKLKRRARPVPETTNPQALVQAYVDRLIEAGAHGRAFDAAFDSLQAEKAFKLTHIATIAQRYAPGIKRPTSKTLAFAAISKRFVEVVKEARRFSASPVARPLPSGET